MALDWDLAAHFECEKSWAVDYRSEKIVTDPVDVGLLAWIRVVTIAAGSPLYMLVLSDCQTDQSLFVVGDNQRMQYREPS